MIVHERYDGGVLVRSFVVLLLAGSSVAQDATGFDRSVGRLIEGHCIQCHGGDSPKADLDLRGLGGDASSVAELGMLLGVRDRLLAGDMPPPGRERPGHDQVKAALEWANGALAARVGRLNLDPGRATIRRLSRVEYVNSIRDLFGIETEVAETFPADDLGYGFDNIGDAVTFSTLHIEKYAVAAEKVAADVISMEVPGEPAVRRIQAAEMASTLGERSLRGGAHFLFTNGRVSATVELPRRGRYRLRAGVWAQQAGPERAKADLLVERRRVKTLKVKATREKREVYEFELDMEGGRRRVSLAFTNDYYRPDDPVPSERDRNLVVEWLEVVGPIDEPPLTRGHRWLFAADPGHGGAARRGRPMLREMLRRIWRRPPTSSEMSGVGGVMEDKMARGASFREALRLALAAALVSPNFLFRVELPSQPDSAVAEDIGPWQLASRLSYFIWSSTPDDELYRLAAKGTLGNGEVLVRQALRMLRDPKATALATQFASQWLELRNLADASPDPGRFPGYTDALAADLRTETERFFESVLREGRPVQDLVDAPYTFVNARLAQHYGLEGAFDQTFRRVALKDGRRGGILGHGSVHVVTSNPTRTSPVKRGKWLLENILGTPPPPPPPGADSFPGEESINDAATLRARMAEHRKNATCASCHVRMDALGLTMENFDAVGRWRGSEGARPVDATGELPDGRKLDGIAALKAFVRRDPLYVRCVAKKLFVYAIGRDVSDADALALELLVSRIGDAPSLEELVLAIVRTDAFRRRRSPG